MLMAVLFTRAKRGCIKCPLTGELIKKMRSIHTMEYYSPPERKDIVRDATTWMNLEDVMLSEISQSRKDKYPTYDPMYMRSLEQTNVSGGGSWGRGTGS